MSADWIARRQARFRSAEAFMKARCILVSVIDRQAQIRTYRVTGKRLVYSEDEIIALAEGMGWEDDHGDRTA
jgi:hypothetical protein